MRRFVEAVRARDHRRLVCDIEEGHRSAALSHLANIREANVLLSRAYRSP